METQPVSSQAVPLFQRRNHGLETLDCAPQSQETPCQSKKSTRLSEKPFPFGMKLSQTVTRGSFEEAGPTEATHESYESRQAIQETTMEHEEYHCESFETTLKLSSSYASKCASNDFRNLMFKKNISVLDLPHPSQLSKDMDTVSGIKRIREDPSQEIFRLVKRKAALCLSPRGNETLSCEGIATTKLRLTGKAQEMQNTEMLTGNDYQTPHARLSRQFNHLEETASDFEKVLCWKDSDSPSPIPVISPDTKQYFHYQQIVPNLSNAFPSNRQWDTSAWSSHNFHCEIPPDEVQVEKQCSPVTRNTRNCLHDFNNQSFSKPRTFSNCEIDTSHSCNTTSFRWSNSKSMHLPEEYPFKWCTKYEE